MSNYHGRIMNMGHEAHYDQSDKMIARDVRHAAAEIANDADAEIAALEAERDALRAKLRATEAAVRLANRETSALVDVAARHTAERDAALAEVERLRKLLAPFSRFADDALRPGPRDTRECFASRDDQEVALGLNDGTLTFGDLRRARTAFATPAQEAPDA